MRLVLAFFLLAAGAFGSRGADDPSLTGKWQVHASAAGRDIDYACAFTQKDNDLTGSCSPDEGTVQITGKVDGKTVTWSYKGQYGIISFKGTLDPATKITGTLTAVDYGVEGEFVATQSK
jgi:hypothetical protein